MPDFERITDDLMLSVYGLNGDKRYAEVYIDGKNRARKEVATLFFISVAIIAVLVAWVVPAVAAYEQLGIDGKPTKYAVGDRFKSKDGYTWELVSWTHTREEGCDWVCSGGNCYAVMCFPTLHDYRWRIKIHAFGAEIDAWTDDKWLDDLKKLPGDDGKCE